MGTWPGMIVAVAAALLMMPECPCVSVAAALLDQSRSLAPQVSVGMRGMGGMLRLRGGGQGWYMDDAQRQQKRGRVLSSHGEGKHIFETMMSLEHFPEVGPSFIIFISQSSCFPHYMYYIYSTDPALIKALLRLY